MKHQLNDVDVAAGAGIDEGMSMGELAGVDTAGHVLEVGIVNDWWHEWTTMTLMMTTKMILSSLAALVRSEVADGRHSDCLPSQLSARTNSSRTWNWTRGCGPNCSHSSIGRTGWAPSAPSHPTAGLPHTLRIAGMPSLS